MTLQELKNQIAVAPDPSLYLNIETKFNFPYIDSTLTFKGASAVYEFVLQQIEGWKTTGREIPDLYKTSTDYFNRIKEGIEYSVSVATQNQFANTWNGNVTAQINRLNPKPFMYNAPETEFLISVYSDHNEAYIGAYDFLIGTVNYGRFDSNYFTGALLAYEFRLKDNSEITQRRDAEKSSMSKIRDDFQKYLSESETQLIEHLRKANEKSEEYVTNIDKIKEEKVHLFSTWFEKANTDFNTFSDQSDKKIKALETSYEQLLSLKKPAEYWRERSIALKKEGRKSLNWVVALVIIAVVCLYFLLWQTPEGMLKTFFGDDKTTALRWSIIFITFISFLAFGIRALIKVTFSSFHLARDAEERESLMFVYLAMVKDSSVSKEDKSLIMQALFSRADTGLLKEDSAPSMPGATSFIEKIK